MKLPPNIKPLPILLEKITKFTGLAFANNIYLRSSFYNDLLKDNPSAESVGILLHEEEHIKRRIKMGMSGFWWGLKYWLDKDFRYQEEIEANRVQFFYLKKQGNNFNLEKRARQLSGYVYLWCTTYQKAIKDLKLIWEKA